MRHSLHASTLAALVTSCLSVAQAQEATAAATAGAPLDIRAAVDLAWACNLNRPADAANFFPGVGTSGKRDHELTLNLAQLDLARAPSPVGFKLSLGFGNAADVVHAAEPRGTATSPDLWRHLLQASVQVETGWGRGLAFEAGIFPSHVGMESFASHANWNTTRSWLGELSPYYQTGVKASYPLGAGFSAQLHLLNGWQVIADNNRGKSLGTQLAYSAGDVSLSFNTIAGPERGDDDPWRVLGDVVATWKATPAFSLGLSVDRAREGRRDASAATWTGVGLYARLAPPRRRGALALRAEYYADKQGAISGAAQILREVTLTFEHRPLAGLLLRLEARHDRSSAAVFSTRERDTAGRPLTTRRQTLLLANAVAVF